MDLGWISMDLDWIFYGFHGSGMDFPWNSWISSGFPRISMDLLWIFYRFHGCEPLGTLLSVPSFFLWSSASVQTVQINTAWIFYEFHGSRMDSPGSGLDFLRFSWIWNGFSMEFMDFSWISMDLAWIFYGCHACRVNFHGVDIDE